MLKRILKKVLVLFIMLAAAAQSMAAQTQSMPTQRAATPHAHAETKIPNLPLTPFGQLFKLEREALKLSQKSAMGGYPFRTQRDGTVIILPKGGPEQESDTLRYSLILKNEECAYESLLPSQKLLAFQTTSMGKPVLRGTDGEPDIVATTPAEYDQAMKKYSRIILVPELYKWIDFNEEIILTAQWLDVNGIHACRSQGTLGKKRVE